MGILCLVGLIIGAGVLLVIVVLVSGFVVWHIESYFNLGNLNIISFPSMEDYAEIGMPAVLIEICVGMLVIYGYLFGHEFFSK